MNDRIQVRCLSCRSGLAVPAIVAGKNIRCPKCQAVIAVPAATPLAARPDSASAKPNSVSTPNASSGSRGRSTSPAQPAARPVPMARPAAPPAKQQPKPVEDYDDAEADGWDDDPYGTTADVYEPPAVSGALPPRSKRKASAQSSPRTKGTGNEPPSYAYDSSPRSSSVNWGGVGTGVLMMVGATVWFVVGLAFGYTFYYPPFLFIFGLVAVVKGFMSSG